MKIVVSISETTWFEGQNKAMYSVHVLVKKLLCPSIMKFQAFLET
jgi:hypothetical protein